MKYHGLVLIAFLATASELVSHGAAAEELPPSPLREVPADEPRALPGAQAIGSPDGPISVESEIRQFRNELSEFQAMREEIAKSAKTSYGEADRISVQQRQELLDLVNKLARKNAARKAATPSPLPIPIPSAADEGVESKSQLEELEPEVPLPKSAVSPTQAADIDSQIESVDPSDAFALGKVLFRSGDFAGAERAFRKAVIPADSEMTLKYLLATCLRRQSQWKAAADTYKQVVDSNQDPVLRDLAKWQLDNIRWHQQSELQLQQLRKQREKRTESNKSAAGADRLKR